MPIWQPKKNWRQKQRKMSRMDYRSYEERNNIPKAEEIVDGWKKIDTEEYRIVDKYVYNDKVTFDGFPGEGLWLVHKKENSRSTQRIFSFEKFAEKPEMYPLIDLTLRADDISSAIIRFIEKKNKKLMDFGSCTYSIHELTEHIIKYLVAQELGGGSKKVLIEKKWIKVKGDEHKKSYEF